MPGSISPSRAIDEAGLDGDFGLTHIEAGARLSFPITGSKLMPYVGGWVGRRSLTTTVDDFETGNQLGPLAVRPRGGRIGRSAVLRVAESRAGRRGQPRHREDGEREGGRSQGGLGNAGQHHHDAAQVRGELVSLTRVSSRAQRGIRSLASLGMTEQWHIECRTITFPVMKSSAPPRSPLPDSPAHSPPRAPLRRHARHRGGGRGRATALRHRRRPGVPDRKPGWRLPRHG